MHHNLKIAQAYSRATHIYDENALIQARVSEQLVEYLLYHEENLNHCTVLDVGCGTGRRAQALAPQCKAYTLGDISEAMIHKAMENCAEGIPVVLDIQNPCFTATFDVIISSLTLHWLQDPKQGLQQLIGSLKPGGRLYLTTMGANSFYEWRAAHSVLNEPCGTPDFVPMGLLKSWLPPQGNRDVFEEWISQDILCTFTYFKTLKRMGSGQAHPSHKPLPIPIIRKVLERFSKEQRISYQILFVRYTKPLESFDE